MIRTVITPEQQNVSIYLPENFVGKQVAVIAFALDETLEQAINTDKPESQFASEKVLARDWLTTEENKAWESL